MVRCCDKKLLCQKMRSLLSLLLVSSSLSSFIAIVVFVFVAVVTSSSSWLILVVMLIVVFKIDPPLCKRTRCCRPLLLTLFIFVVMQIVVFKIAPRRCMSSFNVVVIFRWLPAKLTTEELMLIVVFLNYPPS